jgi:hypothetical protein
MTKSPTEAELVELMDNVSMMELFEEFVCFIRNRAPNNLPGLYSSSQPSY